MKRPLPTDPATHILTPTPSFVTGNTSVGRGPPKAFGRGRRPGEVLRRAAADGPERVSNATGAEEAAGPGVPGRRRWSPLVPAQGLPRTAW